MSVGFASIISGMELDNTYCNILCGNGMDKAHVKSGKGNIGGGHLLKVHNFVFMK